MVQKADLKVNATKPGEKPLSKKQRRQIGKRNRQRERDDMRKIKRAGDNETPGRYGKSISHLKNEDMKQAMSM